MSFMLTLNYYLGVFLLNLDGLTWWILILNLQLFSVLNDIKQNLIFDFNESDLNTELTDFEKLFELDFIVAPVSAKHHSGVYCVDCEHVEAWNLQEKLAQYWFISFVLKSESITLYFIDRRRVGAWHAESCTYTKAGFANNSCYESFRKITGKLFFRLLVYKYM